MIFNQYFIFLFFLISNVSLSKENIFDSEEIKKMHDLAKSSNITNGYVHSWIPFPIVSGVDFKTKKSVKIAPKVGRVSVVFFLASWCLPCQDLISSIKIFESTYKDQYFDFYYIFSHDTWEEIDLFLKQENIKGRILLSDFEVLKNFHNPPLPTVYISDKQGWILNRIEKIDSEEKISILKKKLSFLDVF